MKYDTKRYKGDFHGVETMKTQKSQKESDIVYLEKGEQIESFDVYPSLDYIVVYVKMPSLVKKRGS
jgi:hypothetical protein